MLVEIVTAPGAPAAATILRFPVIAPGVQHVAGNVFVAESGSQLLRLLDAGRAHQHRAPAPVLLLDLAYQRGVFGITMSEHLIGVVDPLAGAMRRDDDGSQVVELFQLVGR